MKRVIGLIRTGVYCRANCIRVTSGLSRVRCISPWFVVGRRGRIVTTFFPFNNDPRNRYKICCKCRPVLCAPTFCQHMMWTRFISMELSTAVIVIINFAGHAALLSQSLSLLRRTPSSLLRNFALCKARSHLSSSSELEHRSIRRRTAEAR